MSAIPKTAYYRCETYRRAVASLPCVRCELQGRGQCAHANSSIFGKGRSIKAHDWASFSMCSTQFGRAGCHAEHDQYVGGLEKALRPKYETGLILMTMEHLWHRGLLRRASAFFGIVPFGGALDPMEVVFQIGELLVDRHLEAVAP